MRNQRHSHSGIFFIDFGEQGDSSLQTRRGRLCSIFFSSIALTKVHTIEKVATIFFQLKSGSKNKYNLNASDDLFFYFIEDFGSGCATLTFC